MAGKFELKRAESGKIMFNLKAGNGQVILTSQMYEDLSGAENGIASVQTNAPLAERFDLKVSAKGEPYFTLLAGNSQIIGRSEMYSSEAARDNGVASVMANAPGAETINLIAD